MLMESSPRFFHSLVPCGLDRLRQVHRGSKLGRSLLLVSGLCILLLGNIFGRLVLRSEHHHWMHAVHLSRIVFRSIFIVRILRGLELHLGLAGLLLKD